MNAWSPAANSIQQGTCASSSHEHYQVPVRRNDGTTAVREVVLEGRIGAGRTGSPSPGGKQRKQPIHNTKENKGNTSQRAAEAAMLHGTDPEEFIKNWKNKYDFLLRTKVPRNSRLVMQMQDGSEIQQQNICRYYPCKEGGKLVKIMPALEEGGEDRRLSLDKEWNVKTCNNILDFKDDIDYDYYIREAEKLIIEA